MGKQGAPKEELIIVAQAKTALASFSHALYSLSGLTIDADKRSHLLD